MEKDINLLSTQTIDQKRIKPVQEIPIKGFKAIKLIQLSVFFFLLSLTVLLFNFYYDSLNLQQIEMSTKVHTNDITQRISNETLLSQWILENKKFLIPLDDDCKDKKFTSEKEFEKWLKKNRGRGDDECLDVEKLDQAEKLKEKNECEPRPKSERCDVRYTRKREKVEEIDSFCEELVVRDLTHSGTEQQQMKRIREARCFQHHLEVMPILNHISGLNKSSKLKTRRGTRSKQKYVCTGQNLQFAPHIKDPDEYQLYMKHGACSLGCTVLRSRQGKCCFNATFEMLRPVGEDTENAIIVSTRYETKIKKIDWLERQPYCWINVAKDNSKADFNKFDLPVNRGDETSGYLSFILRYYDKLPEWMIFIHGDITSQHDTRNVAAFINKRYDVKIEPRPQFADRVGPGKKGRRGMDELLNVFDVSSRNHTQLGATRSCFRASKISKNPDIAVAEETMCTLGLHNKSFFNVPSRCEPVGIFCCAQFALSKSVIKRYPFWFWAELLFFVLDDPCHRVVGQEYKACRCDGPDSRGCFIEYLWPFLWNSPKYPDCT